MIYRSIEKSIVLLLALSSLLFAQNMSINEVLKRAVEVQALQQNYNFDKAITDAQIEQSRVWENPEFEVDLVNGGLEKVGFSVAQTVPRKEKSQTFEKRIEAELSLEKLNYLIQKQEIEAQAYSVIINLLAAQQRISLMDSMRTLSEETKKVIAFRVSRGAAMDLDLLRVENQLLQLQREEKVLMRELLAARKELSLLLALPEENLGSITALLTQNIPLLNNHQQQQLIDSSLALEVFSRSQMLLIAQKAEALAEVKSDFTFSLGYERNNEEKVNEYIMGFSMEIPLFKQEAAALSEIEFTQKKSKNEAFVTKQGLLLSLEKMNREIVILKEEIVTIEDEQLPRTKEIHKRLNEYYKRGRVSVLELLDGEKELVELELTLIDLYKEVALVSAEIYGLTGYTPKAIK